MFLNAFIAMKALGINSVYYGFSEFIPEGNNSYYSIMTLNASTTTQNLSMELNFSVFIGIVAIIGIEAIIFIHEILHLIVIPNFLTSTTTSIGITYWGGFVYTEEVISRTRFILQLLAPFILISVLLPIMLNFLSILNSLVIWLILINAMSSSVDLLSVINILIQVPKDAYITLNGMNSYWKKMDSVVMPLTCKQAIDKY